MCQGMDPRSSSTLKDWFLRIIRTPLLGKLVVLDLVLNLVTFMFLQRTPPDLQEEVTLLSLCAVLVLNVALVGLALQPLQTLEQTARQVSRGSYAVRTQMPWMADRNLVRIGAALDGLLDRVVQERAQARALAAQVVTAGDLERARIARELHDGTAQSLAALDMMLSATSVVIDVPEAREQITAMQQIVGEALQEIRALCQDVHPRVLDDLGLEAALRSLVRRAGARTGAELDCILEGLDAPTSREVASVAYRVVQEAVSNALKHGEPSRVTVTLRHTGDRLELCVSDDGRGFDPGAPLEGGLGVFVMDERVSLVGGIFEIDSRRGGGTVVRASLPTEGP
ncbi:MAG TPA: sensor histidine kinase [Deltaproteobacteria bacterium]|nr:sensor histidine kinase [Deltaproteobacteria bacterium]